MAKFTAVGKSRNQWYAMFQAFNTQLNTMIKAIPNLHKHDELYIQRVVSKYKRRIQNIQERIEENKRMPYMGLFTTDIESKLEKAKELLENKLEEIYPPSKEKIRLWY